MMRAMAMIAVAAAPAMGQVARDSNVARPNSQRAQLEQRVRQRLWKVVQTRIGLTPDQMERLATTEQSLDSARREINRAEVATRANLRSMVLDSASSTNQQRANDALAKLFSLQRQRIDLQEREQRELSAFMTPMQRVRFHALEEQLRRRVAAMRRNGAAGVGGAGPLQAPPLN